jgi:hypothetical protein
MSLVDSLDSVLMLYAYAPLRRDSPDGKLALFWESKAPLPREPRELLADTEPLGLAMAGNSSSPVLLADMSNEGDADPRDKDPLSDQAYMTPPRQVQVAPKPPKPSMSRSPGITEPDACSTLKLVPCRPYPSP